MLNRIIKICAQTLPFAAKIREVTPISAAARVRKSNCGEIRLAAKTISRDPAQSRRSFPPLIYIFRLKEKGRI